jgi:hypothetical protein
VDGRSDLYSLGTVLYELLVGTPPYQAGDPFTVALMHVTHPVPELPAPYEWLQPLVSGLMAKQADQRFKTGAAFVEALHRLLATAPQGAVLQETNTPKAGSGSRIASGAATQQRTRISTDRRTGRPAWFWPAAGAGLLFVAALSGWWLLSPGAAPDSAAAPSEQPLATPAGATPGPTADGGPVPEGFALPKAVDAPDGDELERLLNAGDQLFEYGTTVELSRKLSTPEDESALGYYRRALALDPENARARAGIAGIVAFYRNFGHRACAAERWVQCGVIVRAGLAVDGQDPYLRELQDAVVAGEAGGKPVLPPAPATR